MYLHTRVIKGTNRGSSLSLWGVWMDQVFFLFFLFAHGWTEKSYLSDSRPVLSFPWRRVLACAVGRRRLPSSGHHRRLASRAHFPAIVDDDRGRAGTRRSARSHDPARMSGPARTTRKGKSRLSFFFFYWVLCANDCGRRLWGDIIDQFKCCRVYA